MTNINLPDFDVFLPNEQHYMLFATTFACAFPGHPLVGKMLERAQAFVVDHHACDGDESFWEKVDPIEDEIWKPQATVGGLIAQVIMLLEVIVGDGEVLPDGPQPRAIIASLMMLAAQPLTTEMH